PADGGGAEVRRSSTSPFGIRVALLGSGRAAHHPGQGEGDRMKITILTYVEKEGSTEYDVVVSQVARALRTHGHKVSTFGVHADVKKLLNGLSRRKPALVFNLLEEFGDGLFGTNAAVGLVELLGLPHTGGGPGELYLPQDKALTKKLLAFEGL